MADQQPIRSDQTLAVQETRDLLIQTVKIQSLSGEEREVAEYLTKWMSEHGFHAHIDEAGNAVGERGDGPLTVVLLGHMDTVPGDIPVRIDDQDVLHGRGSVDAKGSLCTFMAAVANLPEETLSKARFVCIGAVEEEAPSSKGARYIMQRYQPQAVLIGEPSAWNGLTLGYKGRLVGKVTVSKDNFHTAGEGTSAADDLAEGWFRVREWAKTIGGEQAGIFNSLQATLQDIGGSVDGMTQIAHATLGFRLPLSLSPTQVERAVHQAFADISQDLHVDIRFVGHETAVRHPKDNSLTRALRVAIRAQGGQPIFKVKTGTSDMNVVAEQWPVPTLAYGPGDSSLDHTPEERLDLKEYDRAITILTEALETWAQKYSS